MIIETRRLMLRELTVDDFDALYRVLSDSDITLHYPYTFDEKRVRNWIDRNIERYRIFGFGLWAVVLKDTGEVIGDCGLTMQNINGTIKPEIGYHIAKEHRRKGYAKEAARACRDWVFEFLPFCELYSYMTKTNTASAATAKSMGMVKVEEYQSDDGTETVVYRTKREELTKAR